MKQLQQGGQGVNILRSGGPAGGEADDGVLVVQVLPEAEGDLGGEGLQLAALQHDKLLIGAGLQVEAVPFVSKYRFQTLGHLNGVAGDTEIEAVGKQGVELKAQQTALGQQGAVLLDEGKDCLLYTSDAADE